MSLDSNIVSGMQKQYGKRKGKQMAYIVENKNRMKGKRKKKSKNY